MRQFSKKIFLALISLTLVAGTLFADYKIEDGAKTAAPADIEVVEKGEDALLTQDGDSYQIDSGQEERMSLIVKKNALLHFAPGSQAQLIFKESRYAKSALVVQLENGRLWLNTFNSSMPAEIAASQITLSAFPGIYDIRYDATGLTIAAYRHSIEAAFSGAKVVVPEHRFMTISEGKLTASASAIAQLRYSKLFKEFPYFENEAPDNWTSKNQADDEAFAKSYREKFENEVRTKGSRFGFDENSFLFKFQNLGDRLSASLTFDSAKKDHKRAADLFDYFDAALYYALIGKNDAASHWFNNFKIRLQEAGASDAIQRSLVDRYDLLAFVQPSSTLFDAKIRARDELSMPPLTAIREQFNDILALAAAGSDVETRSRMLALLRRFGSAAETNVANIQDKSQSDAVFFQGVLINDFLNRNPTLLREEFLKIAEVFEKAHLNLIAEKEVADDQRQFFIAERLARIDMLQKIMEKGDMPFQDGRRSMLMLVSQIEALKPTLSDTAALAYFDQKIDALRPFITFLRSSNAENLHGSFQDSFKEFETRNVELQKVTELLNTASGGIQISPLRREELAGAVTSDLGGVGVSNIRVALPEDEDNPQVVITSASAEGLTFTGVYDTVRKVLSDVVIGKEQIPNAIRLENVKKFFLVKTGKLLLVSGQKVEDLTEAPSKENLVEKVTREKLKKAFEEARINVDEKYFGFENIDDGAVHIRLASIGEGADAKVFSFDISPKTSAVSRLKVQTVSGEIPVNDSFSLRELPIKVEQIYQRAVFEKQKEDELKKFAEEGTIMEVPVAQ